MSRAHFPFRSIASSFIASILLCGTALAGDEQSDGPKLGSGIEFMVIVDDELTLAPAVDEIVVEEEPDWETIARLLRQEESDGLDVALEKLSAVSELLSTSANPRTGTLLDRLDVLEGDLASLWEVIGNPHSHSRDIDSVFERVDDSMAYLSDLVPLVMVEDSFRVERKWGYAVRDIEDLRKTLSSKS
jgi:hypothetical protein